MFSVIILYSEAPGESCLNVKSGPVSNFMPLTLTSFSLLPLVAALGFCSRSVPPSFCPSSKQKLIYLPRSPTVATPSLLFSHQPQKVAGVAPESWAFLRPSHRPPSDSPQGLRSTTRQYASSSSS